MHKQNKMNKFYLIFLLFLSYNLSAQLNFTNALLTATENFDAIGTTATATLPTGW